MKKMIIAMPVAASKRLVSCVEARDLCKQAGTRIHWRPTRGEDTAEVLEG